MFRIFFAITFFFPQILFCDPIKIGIVLPLTGKAAAAGEAVYNGASMANEDTGNTFHLVFEDNALDGSRTASVVKKLINTDKVRGLIIFASGPSNVAAPIAERSQIPMIGLSVDPLVSKQRKWVMIHWAPNREVAKLLVVEAKRREVKKVALLTSQVPGILDLEEEVQKQSLARGLQIVSQQQVLPTETDFSGLIIRMKQEAPDAVFLNLYYGQAGNFASQAAALHFKPQYFGQFVLDDNAEIASSQGALENAFFVSTSAGDLSFDKAYNEKFGKRPVLGGIGAYDAVALFAEAFKAGKTREDHRQFLHGVQNFAGKIGCYGALSNNSFDVPAGVGEIRESKVVKIAQKPEA